MRLFFIIVAVLMASSVGAQNAPLLGKVPNSKLIAAMTREEKARLLVGNGFSIPGMPFPPEMKAPPTAGSPDEKVLGAAGSTAAFARLGIPGTVVTDGPAGVRIAPERPGASQTFYCTAFPIATNLSATWDLDLVKKTGEAMGNEVKEYGADVLLGPGMNIQRNPLGGRNFEYYSEDPLLSGKMAAAMVKGIQSNGVGASVKHFAVNNHETNRTTTDAQVSERALREIYLRGFELVIKEAEPWTVMSSYNKLNGVYTSQNPELLQGVLRKDWGYKGLVMTDWYGGDNAVAQMKAGNELLMPGTDMQYQSILAALESGQLSEKVLDKNLEIMLDYIQKTPSFKGYAYSNKPDLAAHAAVARQVAAEGMVLLKNEGAVLPVSTNKKIAVFGNFSYNLVSGGTGSGDVNEAYTISLPQGLQNAGYTMYDPLRKTYEDYIANAKANFPKNLPFFVPPPPIPEMPLKQMLVENALVSEMAIITIGRVAGEFSDRKTADDFNLSSDEMALIRNVSNTFHANKKKVLVIINVGGSIETASWRDMVDGILVAWQPGQEAGNAIADVLSGKINPSGKLPSSFLTKYEDDQSSAGFPGKLVGEPVPGMMGMPSQAMETAYKEGIYVGYRGLDKKKTAPAYEFGFGKSYTNFAYSGLKTTGKTFNNKMTVRVTVTNSGSVAGKEVAQLYLAAPKSGLDKPEQELRAFAKTKLLQPGESQELVFEIDERALASFDEKKSAWVAEKGNYQIRVGASSRDIRTKTRINMPKTKIVETVSKVLVSP